MWDQGRPGPSSLWQSVGGTFPPDVHPDCPTCSTKRGAFCFVVERENTTDYSISVNGRVSRFPSIHAARWTLYREGGVQTTLF